MANRKWTDEEFIDIWKRLGSPMAVSRETGLSIRRIYTRRDALAKKGIYLPTVDSRGHGNTAWSPHVEFERRRKFEITDGVVIVFSDPHWLPDHSSVASEALIRLIRDLKPKLVVCGGDAVDSDTVSRWDPTRGHHKRFNIREELECVREHFNALDAVLKKAPRAWIMGNHDVRLSRFIAVKAPELKELPFLRLEEWAPKWPLSWTVEINSGGPGMTVIRHRNQAGMLHLQGTKAGVHFCHGHLHKINVHVWPTFNGPRYSVDCGSLADPDSDGFDYTEGAAPHQQGFAVLTFKAGKLMPPELVHVIGGEAWFRGATV